MYSHQKEDPGPTTALALVENCLYCEVSDNTLHGMGLSGAKGTVSSDLICLELMWLDGPRLEHVKQGISNF
jgi:hypothetical protein